MEAISIMIDGLHEDLN